MCNGDEKCENFMAQVKRSMYDIDTFRARTIQSVKIDDNVTLHILPDANGRESTVETLLRLLQENYPAPGKVDVYFPANRSGDSEDTQGTTMRIDSTGMPNNDGFDRVVVLSSSAFTGSSMADPSWHSDSYVNVSEAAYVITHEWGHVRDTRDWFNENPFARYNLNTMSGILDMTKIVRSLSGYGSTDEREAFAESWTDWVITNGNSNNFATKWYAQEYNWPTLSQPISFPPRPITHDQHRSDHDKALDSLLSLLLATH